MSSVVTLLFSAFLSFINPSIEKNNPIKIQSPIVTGVYSTGWESGLSWDFTQGDGINTFHFKKSLPEVDSRILGHGAVLAFVRGYNFSKEPWKEKPLALPFLFFSPEEGPVGGINWQIYKNQGHVQILLHTDLTPQSFKVYGEQVQVRYFILNEAFLRTHKLSAALLQSMPYNSLVALLKVQP